MDYIRIMWNEKLRVYERKRISQEEAIKILKGYYKDISFIGEYQFRLKTTTGWIQTETKEGLTPQPNFFGVCGDWTPNN